MTDRLVELDSVTRLSERVVRILGGNPGKFTLQGTNTYLISPASSTVSPQPCILVDTGEGMASYTAALRKVLEGQDSRAGTAKRLVSDIVLTHRHHDHVGGLPSVLELLSTLQSKPPRLHKFPDEATDEALFATLKQLPSGSYQSHSALDGPVPIHPLKEGKEVSVDGDDGEGGAVTLQVIHSPGHTKDHICLFLQQERALLTGDHVLGQGTSVFEDLGSYLKSLQRCWNVLQDYSPDKETLLYPAHGPTIEQGKQALQDYLSHRLERENQVLELLATTSEERSSGWTIKAIVSKLYSNYPEHLYPAAARGIFLHLRKLALPDDEAIERGVVSQKEQGRRVECIGSVAGEGGLAPEMPNGDSGWIQIMDLQWRLLSVNGDGTGTEQKGSL